MNHTFKDAKLFAGGVEIAEVSEVSYSFDSENERAEVSGLGTTPHGDFTITGQVPITESERQFFLLLGFRFIASITPDGAVGSSLLGVFAWRMLSELQAPLHRRSAMAPFWIKAMQPRYAVCADTLRGCVVRGNQREVLTAYDRIRKEAGDFDAEELKELN
jgi:hypothetical protein